MRKVMMAASAATLAFGMRAALPAQSPVQAERPRSAIPRRSRRSNQMGAALRNLKSFEVRSDTTEERVLTTGQKIQYGGYAEIKGQLPNRLRIDRVNDRKERILYFDGSTLTIYSPRNGFYGSAPATGTIREAAAKVADYYNIETPARRPVCVGRRSGRRRQSHLGLLRRGRNGRRDSPATNMRCASPRSIGRSGFARRARSCRARSSSHRPAIRACRNIRQSTAGSRKRRMRRTCSSSCRPRAARRYRLKGHQQLHPPVRSADSE